MDYRNTKWARQIIDLQKDDGSWGYFHTLSNPTKKQPITTEQALRRLQVLGFTINDEPIKNAVAYLVSCLEGKTEIRDRKEKSHSWDIYVPLMLSVWILKFDPNNQSAIKVANKWANAITGAFKNGSYNYDDYQETYLKEFECRPHGDRILDFRTFYQISITARFLDDKTSQLFFDYILNNEQGIYYVYGSRISQVPDKFCSLITSRYLSAIELLCELNNRGCLDKLEFVADWLIDNRRMDGKYDLSSLAKDGVYFPLSDSWRQESTRIADCTYRINKILTKIAK